LGPQLAEEVAFPRHGRNDASCHHPWPKDVLSTYWC
jgi:hypothetical protein